MTDPASPTPPELSLLKTLHHPSTGPSRSWQSIAHPDPSAPLLATASADKTVNIWNLRDYSLISTISGGHKRSVRAVAWKDYGRTNSSVSKASRKPVVLGTGSFDANVGIWIWNDDRRGARFRDNDKPQQDGREEASSEETDTGMGMGMGARDDTEIDLTRDGDGEEEDEEWHFSTLLTGPDSEIKSIEFSPPHYATNLLATCSRDKSVWIWEEVEPEEWETIAVLSEHTGDVKCVSWCAGAKRGNGSGRKTKRRRLLNGERESDGDVEMGNGNGNGNVASSALQQEEDGEDEIIGSRDVLASGSYDDTIRLWRDVEEEGDWICVGVIEGHRGTVWDVKWEGYINYGTLDLSHVSSGSGQDSEKAIAEFEADWQPRIVSCSDDMTVRIWRRELSEAEKAKRAQARIANSNSNSAAAPMGFASSRLPSVIRPMSSMERWVEDVVLPQVHVRNVYAVDWSSRTGLVVSCGGDGAIAVYKEVVDSVDTDADADVVMNGTGTATSTTTDAAHSTDQQEEGQESNGNGNGSQPYKMHKMKWVVVALIEAAHDEYEVNHVCWAERRDKDKRYDGEEVIISTGDEGHVRVWTLPDGLMG
ncbi:Cytosolic iron-sulfur protein assembly protein [Exophiala xenobiotica]|nr:Cytosolic iron-sulfur protein assembly protein [Exophiala xenobiotica]